MKKISKLLGAASLLVLSGGASATMWDVDGITWDSTALTDFSNFSLAIHQDINSITGEVSGYGSISTVNSTGQSVFGAVSATNPFGTELTFTFGGFTPMGSTLLPSAGTVISYKGGDIKVFADDSNPSGGLRLSDPVVDPTTLTLANTSNGLLFLELKGHVLPDGSVFDGTTNAFGNVLSGGGLLDVIGGDAMTIFQTKTKPDGFGGFADYSFTNSFTQFPSGSLGLANGTGNFNSKSLTQVPEPTILGLLGAGLFGFAALRRKVA